MPNVGPHPLPVYRPREKEKKKGEKIRVGGGERVVRTLRLLARGALRLSPSSRLRLTQFIALRPAACLLALLLSRYLHALRFKLIARSRTRPYIPHILSSFFPYIFYTYIYIF